ncbi:MAG: hypothetical protein A2002_07975 [Pseudomonadales bacterium GWC1_66_9]|nr:MAG: hypothetical protein A2002_07975 [Pseudomonadales bacterium GWC1_66_9]
MIDSATCRCARWPTAGAVIRGKRRYRAGPEVFFSLAIRSGQGLTAQALPEQKTIGGDAQAGMVVEPPPTTPLVMPQPQVLLEILVVALDTPAQMGDAYQFRQRRVLHERGQPVAGRLVLRGGPFDQ